MSTEIQTKGFINYASPHKNKLPRRAVEYSFGWEFHTPRVENAAKSGTTGNKTLVRQPAEINLTHLSLESPIIFDHDLNLFTPSREAAKGNPLIICGICVILSLVSGMHVS